MGHCYSLDLRVRVADFVEAGHSCRAVAQHFDVSESFAIKLVQRKRRFGSPAPARQGRPPGRGKLVPYESFLIETVEARPAITMPELAARLLVARQSKPHALRQSDVPGTLGCLLRWRASLIENARGRNPRKA